MIVMMLSNRLRQGIFSFVYRRTKFLGVITSLDHAHKKYSSPTRTERSCVLPPKQSEDNDGCPGIFPEFCNYCSVETIRQIVTKLSLGFQKTIWQMLCLHCALFIEI